MKAVFEAGCFWGVQKAFDEIKGIKTLVGYAGGTKKNPSYEDVCMGGTGHTEVILIEYDPKKTPYSVLLDKFWGIHDPTVLHKDQYKSVIFYFNEQQRRGALASMKEE